MIRQFLGHLEGGATESFPCVERQSLQGVEAPTAAVSIYYGIDGKRKAAVLALNAVLALRQPATLLLFSDEETSWMTEDPAFAKQWAELMFQVIARGHRMKVIHTINRRFDEMLSAIGQWMPLYMTGGIEPFYYPKMRDGVFRRTLFIAPETVALVSSSVGEGTIHAANELHTDPKAIAAYEDEFQNYLKLCNPLMLIFTEKDRDAALHTLLEFEKEGGISFIKTESLSLLTMPEELLASIVARTSPSNDLFQQYHAWRLETFHNNIRTNAFTEIVKLPDPQDVLGGRVKIASSVMMAGGAHFYEASEYLAHLANVIQLLERNENYNVCLVQGSVEERYTVYAKENKGVLVAKTSQPPVMLAMSESNMTASFWDFLSTQCERSASGKTGKPSTAQQLKDYIALF